MLECLACDGRRAGQKLVKDHPQRVQIGPGVDVDGIEGRLLRGHVQRCADHGTEAGEECVFRELHPAGGLGQSEVDHARHGLAVVRFDQDIGRLQVAVDDALLMGVLHRRANLHEQHQPFAHVELVLVAEFNQRDPLHQLHREKRHAVRGGAGIEQLGNVRVIHERNGLPFGLETGEDHARAAPVNPDQLDGHLAFDRFNLLGHPDAAHAPFADRLQQLVPAGDHGPGRSDRGVIRRRRPEGSTAGCHRKSGVIARILIQRIPRCRRRREQALQPLLERLVTRTLGIQPLGSFLWIGDCQRGREELDFVHLATSKRKACQWSLDLISGFRGATRRIVGSFFSA